MNGYSLGRLNLLKNGLDAEYKKLRTGIRKKDISDQLHALEEICRYAYELHKKTQEEIHDIEFHM